jgi:hypothetical protein
VSFTWVDAPEDLDAGAILTPSVPARAGRWRAALDGLAPVAPEALAGRHVVVAVGDGTPAAGLAAGLDRELVTVADVGAVADLIRTGEPDSVLAVVRPEDLHLDAVEAINGAVLATDRTIVGVVTGSDEAARSFAAAKCLTSPAAGELLGIDALTRAVVDRTGAVVDPRAVADVDGELVVLAHGEGAHLNLQSVVLCGLVGEREAVGAGELAGGCRRDDGCKKVRDPATVVVRVDELPARGLTLLSCNSFSVAGQLYPSTSSLVLAAVEGPATGVIALAHQVPIRRQELDAVGTTLEAGLRRGEAVRLLNEAEARRGVPTSHVLVGDPMARPAVAAGDASVLATASLPAVAAVPSTRPRVVLGDGRALGPPGVADDLVDRGADLAELVDRLTDLGTRSRFAAILEEGIDLVRRGTPQEEELGGHLEGIALERRKVEAAVWRGLAATNRAERSHAWDDDLPRHLERAVRPAARWQAHVAGAVELLIQETGAGLADRLLPSLHPYPARWVEPHGACPRCGAPTNRRSYAMEALGVPDRWTVECVVCGPLHDHAAGDDPVVVELVGELRPGAGALARVHLPDAPTVGPRSVVGQVRDKSRNRPLEPFSVAVAEGAAGCIDVPFTVPDDSRPDLWTVRAAVVAPLRVTFARRIHTPMP